ncbi:MAG: hypothetical protein ACRDYY_12235, partial [Acidimicrobiales bacterium]
MIRPSDLAPPAWTQLPAPPPLLDPMPLALSRVFEESLISWQAPDMSLGDLGHAVTPSAPAGVVAAVAVLSPAPDTAGSTVLSPAPDTAGSTAAAPRREPAGGFGDAVELPLAVPQGPGGEPEVTRIAFPGWAPDRPRPAGP